MSYPSPLGVPLLVGLDLDPTSVPGGPRLVGLDLDPHSVAWPLASLSSGLPLDFAPVLSSLDSDVEYTC